MFNTYVYIYTLTTYYSGLRNTLSQNVWVCICLCVCVSVCICVHNLTSVPGDLLPGQLSAGCIRRPVGYSLDNSRPRLSTETISLTGGRWSLIGNQIFFGHAYISVQQENLWLSTSGFNSEGRATCSVQRATCSLTGIDNGGYATVFMGCD